ncbi:cyclase-like protein 3 [Citrus sinensis]|uniref:Cyclase-like protein 3 n=1 Tax=Citrus sinensis TaxID=2711 RepID=A0ACB8IE52_CITSI|nr:cyclase-like protein 3 [Citrus sinensis]
MVKRCTRVLLTTSRPLAADGVPERSEAHANGRMFDISHRVAKDLSSWDSKDGLGQFLFPLASIKNGSDVNASETKMSVRTGTHVNAPSYMFYNYSNAGFDADSLDLQVLNGPALLVDVPIRDRNITVAWLGFFAIPGGVLAACPASNIVIRRIGTRKFSLK